MDNHTPTTVQYPFALDLIYHEPACDNTSNTNIGAMSYASTKKGYSHSASVACYLPEMLIPTDTAVLSAVLKVHYETNVDNNSTTTK
jgi:hypothetical protein